VEIEVLHRQGRSIREIARETGVARNTVRQMLRGNHNVEYGPRKPRPTKLDPYKAYLGERIESAGSHRLNATVLLRELRERGYECGITQLKDYLVSIRPQSIAEPVIRFETPPGRQLQIDFVVFRRGEQPLRAFTAELGYSRYPYVEFTDNERTDTLIACLERALQHFGGVPEEVLCDNPKTIVLERNAYGEGRHRFNPLLLDFARHYGMKIAPCAPYRAQTKGKIERFHRYLRESFFVPLQTQQSDLVDVATANREVRPWLHDIAACRIHATLKERPIDRFVFERDALRALPLLYGGHPTLKPYDAPAVPLPVESLQHPLATYEQLAKEIAA